MAGWVGKRRCPAPMPCALHSPWRAPRGISGTLLASGIGIGTGIGIGIGSG